ncbi:GAF domain-containing protein [Botrimarina sp.]|uniref:GAF domain-containing protein n=1 Tax=Botrimarina sp. TaxID=2795802 RepID=UPI0032EB8F98
MEKLRPKGSWEKLGAGELFFEVPLAVAVVVQGAIASINYCRKSPPELDLAIGSGLGALLAGVVLLWRAFVRHKKASKAESHSHELDAVLHTLHAVLIERTDKTREASLRICVFVPGRVADTIHQITNYVGDGPPHGAGRDLPCSKGVVGLAFRTGEAKYDKAPGSGSLADYYVKTYGYAREEAAGMRQDRSAWAAIPLVGGGRVLAVVFLDSDRRDFFGKANSPQRKTIESATLGVARFVQAR